MIRPLLIAAVLLLLAPTTAKSQVLAFPEAEGFGRYATGARTNLSSASVYHVTNLNDSGSGSFRDAVSQPNRFVVFDVGGIVNVSPDASTIVVSPNVTIAGQTAPGGIVIYGNRVSYSGANNTITRHLAIRKGNAGYRDDASGAANGVNMMFDHMSVTWGVDETFSLNWDGKGSGLDSITIQDSIIAQGQDRLGHSAGGLMTLPEGSQFSVIRSLFSDNVTRNPKVRGENEFINNVVYGWDNAAYIMGDTTSMDSHANAIGNYFIESTVDGSSPFRLGSANFHIYGEDNWVDDNRNGVLDGVAITSYPGADVVTSPHAFPTNASMSAQEALAYVMQNAGPSIVRDAVDTRLMEEVASYGTLGGIIQRETDLFPNYGSDSSYLNPRARLVDNDNDGIADHWEATHGMSSTNPDDWSNTTRAGYTRLEQYINELGSTGSHVTSSSGDWNSGTTWGGGVPTLADTVTVAGTVNHTSGYAYARRLIVGGSLVSDGGNIDVFDTAEVQGVASVSQGELTAGRVLIGSSTQAGLLAVPSGGRLQTGVVAAGHSGSVMYLSGGTFAASATPDIQVNTILGDDGGTIDTQGLSGQMTGTIAGSGGLTKQGSGSLTLVGSCSYTGPTVVKTGELVVPQSGGLNQSSGVEVQSGAKLTLASGAGQLALTGDKTLTGSGTIAGNVVMGAGAVVTPQGAVAITNQHAIGLQAEDLTLGSDWAVFNNSVHGTGAGGSYDGSDLNGGGIVMVSGEDTSAPTSTGAITTTLTLPDSSTWYLFVKTAEPSLSAVAGDISTGPRGNNSLYVSAVSSDLQATLSNYEVVQTNATDTSAIDAATWNCLSATLSNLTGVLAPEDAGIDYTLSGGQHTLTLYGREAGTIVDGLVLSDSNLTAEQLEAALTKGGLESEEVLTIEGNYTQSSGATFAVDVAGGDTRNKLLVKGTATIAGDLSITLADDFTPEASDVFEILEATTLAGQFDNAAPGTRLYTTDGAGSFVVQYDYTSDLVTLSDFVAGIGGDFNGDGVVDMKDYTVWRNCLGTDESALPAGSGDGSGIVDAGDFSLWKANFGFSVASASAISNAAAVPEPAALPLGAIGLAVAMLWRWGGYPTSRSK